MNDNQARQTMADPGTLDRNLSAEYDSASNEPGLWQLLLPMGSLVTLILFGTAILVVAGADEQKPVPSVSQSCHLINTMASHVDPLCQTQAGSMIGSNQQRQVCLAERVVDSLVTRIEREHAAMATSEQELKTLYLLSRTGEWSARSWRLLSYAILWSYRQISAVDDYWRIGSLESSLLIAYSELGASKALLRANNMMVACDPSRRQYAGSSVVEVSGSRWQD